MADFRKWIIALTALGLSAGLASAQSGLALSCNAAADTPQLRSEGFTELTGDIVLTCTGGLPLAQGATIPTANITVYMNSTVTSRLLGNSSVPNASEALLLIDNPSGADVNSGSSYGQQQQQILCGSGYPLAGAGPNGCVEYVGNSSTGGTGVAVATNPNTGTNNAFNPNQLAPAPNVFQGVVNGSSVTFYGVPVQPPASSGATRTFRMTNIRINAFGIGSGALTPATASIAVTGTAAMPVTNSLVTVGYISKSLSTSVKNSSSPLLQCQAYGTSTTPEGLETLRYSELQGSAFKVRGTTSQNVPGQIYTNAESGFTYTGLAGLNSTTNVTHVAGYADWGTRVKAVFSNIPSGVTLYVSTTNVNSGPTAPSAAMVAGETTLDIGPNDGTAGASTFLPLVSQTGVVGGVSFAPVVTSGNGVAQAVWEVVSSNQNIPENLDFAVYLAVTPSLSNNTPPAPSTMNVNMSYAPTPSQGSFTAAAGGAASAVLGIPRFADTSTGVESLSFEICQTALLYPYVINAAGFDTGLSVSNTSSDPFGTDPQSGYCSIYWYGANQPATNPGYLGGAGYQSTIPTSSQAIQGGTIQSWGASVAAPNFSGYVIALCNFQYAHGFAFVSDLGARNLAMGYLAEVLTTNDIGSNRGPGAETLGQ